MLFDEVVFTKGDFFRKGLPQDSVQNFQISFKSTFL